jgi:cephalosporin hydroxylase
MAIICLLLCAAAVADNAAGNGQCDQYGRPPLDTLQALMARRKVKPIPTFFENFVRNGDNMVKAGHLPREAQVFVDGAKEAYSNFKNPKKRFVSMSERREHEDGSAFYAWDHMGIGGLQLDLLFMKSQGVVPFRYLGMALYKTAYDFALQPMLIHELKPATIIEIGAGEGASAIWYADTLRNSGLAESKVYSFDWIIPEIDYPGVTFIKGDSNNVQQTWSKELMESLPHPWLVVDDAHVNLGEVLPHIYSYMKPGDYMVVEDISSGQGRDDFKQWLKQCGEKCKVDSKYCDYFGENLTSAPDAYVKIFE